MDEIRRCRDVVKASVSPVSIQLVLAPIRDEQVLVSIVVVVASARALSPTAGYQPSARRDVLERAVAPVSIEMIRRLLALWKTLQRGAVHEKDVEPAIPVVVEGRHARAGRLEQIRVCALRAVNRPCSQAGLGCDVGERESKVDERCGARSRRGAGAAASQAARASQDASARLERLRRSIIAISISDAATRCLPAAARRSPMRS